MSGPYCSGCDSRHDRRDCPYRGYVTDKRGE